MIIPADSRVNNRQPDEIESGVVKLVAWTSQGDMIQALYRHGPEGIPATTEEPSEQCHRLPLEPTSQTYLSSKFVDEDELDHFIIEDQIGTQDAEIAYAGSKLALHGDVQILPHRTASLQWDNILDDKTLQSDGKNRPSASESLDSLYSRGPRALDHSFLISTLSHLLGAPRILDLEAATQSLDEWLSSIQVTDQISIQPINSHSKSLLYKIQGTTLLAIYNSFLLAYIDSLLWQVTNRIRVNREKIVRQVTADALFSGIALRRKASVSETGKILQTSPEQVVSSDPPLYSSQPLMGTSPSLAQELIVGRLRNYAKFKRESPPMLSKNSISISNILEHLPNTINSDPQTYSYEAANQRIQNAQDEEGELSLDARERRKVIRQSTKRQKALEKQAKYTRAVQSERLVPPSVSSRRLAPALPGREVQSSQPGVPESSQGQGQSQSQGAPMLNMSQPERGVHGTRPLSRKKGKDRMVKRKEGF